MTSDNERLILDRVNKTYEYLVDNTENKAVIYHPRKSDTLSKLLELFEYLIGNDEDNPITSWFE